jgi:hypothetical protein
LASQSPAVWLCIGSNWPRHRQTKSNDEFPPPHVHPPHSTATVCDSAGHFNRAETSFAAAK